MKPHRLTISGLQSFRVGQDIDFDRLSDHGMFGIFGPTGSGKSTILDAITLALYGRVGRAKSGKQGIINEAETTAAVSFSFSIGAGDERRTYRVERKYRTRDHVSVSSSHSRLVELTPTGDAVLADQENAVTAMIERILGITLDDFIRAVVLPQGKFADFLTLKGVDRRRMLERLFALERYGEKLAARVKSRREAAVVRRGELQGELQGMGDASEAAVIAARETMERLQTEAQQAEQLFTAVKLSHAEAAQIANLQQELADRRQDLASQREHEGDIAMKEQRLAAAREAAKTSPWLTKAAEARRESEQAVRREIAACSAQAAARENASTTRQEYDQACERRLREEPVMTVQRQNLEAALELESGMLKETERQVEAMAQLTRIAEQLATIDGKVKNRAAELTRLDETLFTLKQQLQKCQVSTERRNVLHTAGEVVHTWESWQRRTDEARADRRSRELELQTNAAALQQCCEASRRITAELAASELELATLASTCPTDAAKLAAKAAELEHLSLRLRQWDEQQREVEVTIKSVDTLRLQYSEAAKTVHVLTEQAHSALALYEQVQCDCNEALRNDRLRMASVLARDLTPGQACPVCGSLAHPQLAHEELAVTDNTQLQKLKETLEARQAAWKRAESAAAAARETVAALAARGAAEADNLKQRTAQLAEQLEAIAIELGLDESDAVDRVTACRAALERQQQQHKASCQAWGAWQEAEKSLNSRLEALRKQDASLAAELAAAQVKKESAAAELAKIAEKLQVLERNLTEAAGSLGAAVADLGVDPAMSTVVQASSVKQMTSDLKRQDEDREKLEREIAGQSDVRFALAEEREGLRQQLQTAELEQAERKVLLAGVEASLQDLKRRWRDITAGASAAALLTELALAMDELKTAEKAMQQKWEAADQARQQADSLLAAAVAASSQTEGSRNLAEEQLRDAIAAAGFVDEAAAQASLLPENVAESEQNFVQQYREQYRQLQLAAELVETELAGRSVTPAAWQELQDRLSAAESDLAAKQRSAIEAAQTHRELAAKQRRWNELAIELSKLQSLLDALEIIFGLIRGNMLVEYLAQEQMDLVLRNASERLKQLTHNRYALEIDSEGSFIIRDDANGGVRRPAGSLSGGETFQTSLALALALSDQIQLRGKYPLEFFFLDEGFGSLDRRSLELSMATLERLRHDRLTIGIISHVEELQQRMPRRLLVTPPDLKGNGSRVQIEIA